MAKARPRPSAKLPPAEAEDRRLFGLTQLHRFVRVIGVGNSAIEFAPQPGCRISISVEIDGDTRRVRIIAGEIKPPPPFEKASGG